MNERRRHRSTHTGEALRMLLEAVRGRSEISSIAVVDARGLVVSGSGTLRELAILGTIAAPAAEGFLSPSYERLTDGTDIMARAVETPTGTMYLAALGQRVSRMVEAARGVERILALRGSAPSRAPRASLPR
ncbi:MAG TPA: hypothetical protein VIF62_36390 [Labilithrix sp.]